MKKKLKDELEDKNTVQEYVCPNCGKRFQHFFFSAFLCVCLFDTGSINASTNL